jgi:5-(carboxyamino)imidazole ribonucleotide synthase
MTLDTNKTIGIIGGGQLARMLSFAAFQFGYRIAIFEPEENCPASQVTDRHFCASYDDENALEEFAKSCDIVTFEFENIPVDAVKTIAKHAKIYPNPDALGHTQDRLSEKEFVRSLGLPCAPFYEINSLKDLEVAIKTNGLPAILKTRRFGYDGKGQFIINDASQAAQAWDELGQRPCVLEGFVEFSFETSMILTRGQDGEILYFPNSQNIHKDGILRKSMVPSPLNFDQIEECKHIGRTIAEALNYIGTLTVEIFVGKNGLVVNEIAPRVHNSGHWTIEGCKTSQFEAHIRAICGLPLGSSALMARGIEMENLLGDEILHAFKLAADGNVFVHIYGKKEIKPARKMGHFTRLFG